jgi:hypothetical protein
VPEPAPDDLGLGGLGQRVGGEAPKHEPAVLEVTAAHRAPRFEVDEELERLRPAQLLLGEGDARRANRRTDRVAVDVHTGWHWMLDRGDVLWKTEWPRLNAESLTTLARWVAGLLLAVGIVHLARRAGALLSRRPTREGGMRH